MCNIRFTGELCDDLNLPYHAGIGGVFIFIGKTVDTLLQVYINGSG